MSVTPTFLIVDLFCGAGGTTTGFAMAEREGNKLAKVIACVNHDAKAIESHWRNHPDVKHFEEDIRTLDLTELIALTRKWQSIYPEAKLVLWASLECTNFSKAKGGQPRDADSRTLADHLDRYILALDPDYVQIENVVEFMSWGPLDANGKPLSRKAGSDWMRWRNHIDSFGYRNEWKELNSADFGAYTSRNRLFGCFAKHGLPIVWPQASHAKKPVTGNMFVADLKKWKAVKDVLDFADEGESIFTRKKELSPKTLERIYAGLIKYVAGGKEAFLQQTYALPKVNLVQAEPFILNGNFGHDAPVKEPAPTVTASRRHHYIVNPSHGGHSTSIDAPCPVIIARQDKAPLYLIDVQHANVAIPVYEGEPEIMVKIKTFMALYGISDIKMRMLKVLELLKIQGFPDGYNLAGNQSDQKKFIGNSVVPHVVKAWCEAMGLRLFEERMAA